MRLWAIRASVITIGSSIPYLRYPITIDKIPINKPAVFKTTFLYFMISLFNSVNLPDVLCMFYSNTELLYRLD